MEIKKHIPNTITLFNLLSGCLSIYMVSLGKIEWACYLILIGGAFDFADGLVARVLNVKSEIGKQLDSLADMVTFGVAPSFLVADLVFKSFESIFMGNWQTFVPRETPILFYFLLAPAFLLALFAALRLAKFNIDDNQTENFIGLPTPAMAIFVLSIAYSLKRFNSFELPHLILLYVLILFFCYLMVSKLPMFSLKFNNFGWKGNEVRLVFLIICGVIIAVYQLAGLSLCILLYIVLSYYHKLVKK